MSYIPIPKRRISDTRQIHRVLARDCPDEIDGLLVAHAGAVSSAPSIEEYRRHHDVMRDFARRHWIEVGALRMVLGLIATGTFSRTFPLVKTTEGTCLQDAQKRG